MGLLLFVVQKIDAAELYAILRRVDWRWAFLGWSSTGVLIVALAWRWRIFLEQQQIDLPFCKILSLTWAGQFFNSILPGSTGGDVFKIFQICRLIPNRRAAATASVLLDRLCAFCALGILAGVACLFQPPPLRAILGHQLGNINFMWVTSIFILGLSIAFYGYRLVERCKWTGEWAQAIRAVIQNMRLDASVASGTGLAFAIHLLNFLSVFFLARSLGLGISCVQALLMLPVVLLIVMLPITVNGHGLREVLLIAYFAQMGIGLGGVTIAPAEFAVALSLLMVGNDLLWSLPGGLQYLLRVRVDKEPELTPSPIY